MAREGEVRPGEERRWMVPRDKVTRTGPWKSLGPGEGKGGRSYPFFFLWWKGENGMGERRWAGATESYQPMLLKAGGCKSVMVVGS